MRPILQATIAEIQRLCSVAAFPNPHDTTVATRVGQFTFPAQSVFLVNIGFIMKDPAYFDKPEEFNPYRFISSEGR